MKQTKIVTRVQRKVVDNFEEEEKGFYILFTVRTRIWEEKERLRE